MTTPTSSGDAKEALLPAELWEEVKLWDPEGEPTPTTSFLPADDADADAKAKAGDDAKADADACATNELLHSLPHRSLCMLLDSEHAAQPLPPLPQWTHTLHVGKECQVIVEERVACSAAPEDALEAVEDDSREVARVHPRDLASVAGDCAAGTLVLRERAHGRVHVLAVPCVAAPVAALTALLRATLPRCAWPRFEPPELLGASERSSSSDTVGPPPSMLYHLQCRHAGHNTDGPCRRYLGALHACKVHELDLTVLRGTPHAPADCAALLRFDSWFRAVAADAGADAAAVAGVVAALRSNRTLEWVVLRGMTTGSTVSQAVAALKDAECRVTQLDLGGCRLNGCAKTLADVLRARPFTHVALARCRLGHSALHSVLDALCDKATAPALRTLDLSGNHIGKAARSKLNKLVSGATGLCTLRLGDCDAVLASLDAISKHGRLTELDVSGTALTEKDLGVVQALTTQARDGTPGAGFHVLSLDRCTVPAKPLGDVLAAYLGGNGIGSACTRLSLCGITVHAPSSAAKDKNSPPANTIIANAFGRVDTAPRTLVLDTAPFSVKTLAQLLRALKCPLEVLSITESSGCSVLADESVKNALVGLVERDSILFSLTLAGAAPKAVEAVLSGIVGYADMNTLPLCHLDVAGNGLGACADAVEALQRLLRCAGAVNLRVVRADDNALGAAAIARLVVAAAAPKEKRVLCVLDVRRDAQRAGCRGFFTSKDALDDAAARSELNEDACRAALCEYASRAALDADTLSAVTKQYTDTTRPAPGKGACPPCLLATALDECARTPSLAAVLTPYAHACHMFDSNSFDATTLPPSTLPPGTIPLSVPDAQPDAPPSSSSSSPSSAPSDAPDAQPGAQPSSSSSSPPDAPKAPDAQPSSASSSPPSPS